MSGTGQTIMTSLDTVWSKHVCCGLLTWCEHSSAYFGTPCTEL